MALTDAVLLTVSVVPARTMNWIFAELPEARPPRLHVTTVVPLQVPCDDVAETSDRLGESMSVTVTPVAAAGPALWTVIV